jgi:hypothetical protein
VVSVVYRNFYGRRGEGVPDPGPFGCKNALSGGREFKGMHSNILILNF